ncbi:MAG: cell division FtsK/SpoIIIE [Anaerocolumna sp.]|jgi:S-DNA-T family DNA segregation ATPase FtsK/SpoIIIE|nr:cell division FtsK/SpoIIIE [Anaerocolumna sp.]
MKEVKDSRMLLVETSIYSFITGFGTELIDPSLSPLCKLLKIVGVLGITYYAYTWSKFDLLFKNLKLGVSTAYPIIKGKEKTEYSDIYRFTLPKGICLQDFLDKQEAIENSLGREVDIKYTYKTIQIEVYKENQKTHYDYEPTKISGDVPIIIGYSRRGELVSCDLSSGEPHVLIAGETGSGKSTTLRSIICNLILMSKVRLHLVDLKNGAELGLFRKCSNVDSFCRNMKQAKDLLMQLSIETDRRYDMFYEKDVKDIKDYNKKYKTKMLDYQILIIDEFADLHSDKECMSILKELARKSRACGIHLIISTQRPSATVIDGDIKANITNSLGLKTINGTNSSIVIDETGLEKLRGDGHGKFKRGGKIIEIQCPYLDVNRCRELIKQTYVEKDVQKSKQPTQEDLLNAIENM